MFAPALLIAAFAALSDAAPANEKVTYLPEMSSFDTFGVYSGYADVDWTNISLHYVFVES